MDQWVTITTTCGIGMETMPSSPLVPLYLSCARNFNKGVLSCSCLSALEEVLTS